MDKDKDKHAYGYRFPSYLVDAVCAGCAEMMFTPCKEVPIYENSLEMKARCKLCGLTMRQSYLAQCLAMQAHDRSRPGDSSQGPTEGRQGDVWSDSY